MFRVLESVEYSRWLARLKDGAARGRIAARVRLLEAGHRGDSAHLGDGVLELRLHFGPGYRVYFTEIDGSVVILLGGGDKGSQARDIRKAKRVAERLRREWK